MFSSKKSAVIAARKWTYNNSALVALADNFAGELSALVMHLRKKTRTWR
jgi:hypothetical protein